MENNIVTPKQKAEEIYALYNDYPLTADWKKQCAIIAVDQILKARPGYPYPHEAGVDVQGIFKVIRYPEVFWTQVKAEISSIDETNWIYNQD